MKPSDLIIGNRYELVRLSAGCNIGNWVASRVQYVRKTKDDCHEFSTVGIPKSPFFLSSEEIETRLFSELASAIALSAELTIADIDSEIEQLNRKRASWVSELSRLRP